MAEMNIQEDVLLDIGAPALNATTDNPNLKGEQEQPNAPLMDESRGVDAPRATTPEEEDAQRAKAEETPPEIVEKPKPDDKPPLKEGEEETVEEHVDKTEPWMKARISKADNRARAAEAESASAKRMLAEALETMKKLTAQPVAEAPKAPTREAFDDPDAYAEAKAAFVAEQMVEKKMAEFRQTETKRHQEVAAQAAEDARQAFLDKGREKYEDFAEKCERDDLLITVPMFEAAKRSKIGEDIVYYLGEHTKEVDRIRKLEPIDQILAIAEIEAKLKTPAPAPPAKPPSKAPTPIKPVKSEAKAVGKTLEEMSMDEYEREIFLPALKKARGM